MLTEIAAALAALGGVTIGTVFSETIKSTADLVFSRGKRRADQVPAMRSVVLSVDRDWKGSRRDYGELSVAILEAFLTVENHSDQLIKNVRASMRRRPNGVDTAQMVPGIAAKEAAPIVVRRELGLLDDQPFEEDERDWLDLYWFEVDWEDTYGKAWRLHYNPRDEKQTVVRLNG